MLQAAPYIQPEWQALRPLVGIGGGLLFVSALLYFLNMLLTCVASHAPAPEISAFAEALSGPEEGRPSSIAGAPGWSSRPSCSCWPMATPSSIW